MKDFIHKIGEGNEYNAKHETNDKHTTGQQHRPFFQERFNFFSNTNKQKKYEFLVHPQI